MNQNLFEPGGIIPQQESNAAARGIYNSGIRPQQEAQTLQNAQSELANISTQPDLTSAIAAQNTLYQGLGAQMQAAQSMASGMAGINQIATQQSQNSPYNFGGLLGTLFPHGIQQAGNQTTPLNNQSQSGGQIDPLTGRPYLTGQYGGPFL